MRGMHAFTEKQAASWAETRKQGRDSFIKRRGVIGWGLPTGILFSLLMGFLQGWDRLPFLLPVALVMFPIGGIYWGRWVWDTAERAYAAYLKDNSPA
jgi:hypothetical protein